MSNSPSVIEALRYLERTTLPERFHIPAMIAACERLSSVVYQAAIDGHWVGDTENELLEAARMLGWQPHA